MNCKNSLLPAVMISVAAINTLTVATKAHATSPSNAEEAVPAVLSVRPPSEYPVPQRLTEYTNSIADATNLSKRKDHCATISGSDSGWDDSDCF